MSVTVAAPRLGFLGVGWIGRNRMEAVASAKAGSIAALAEPDPELRDSAAAFAPEAATATSLDDLLELDLDGVVIATPSALHAEQSVAALARGLPVFCQKPLGRDEAEARAVVDAARRADRLLGVDLSYRQTAAARALKQAVASLGRVYAVDLVFHNAYGPDKAWFRQRDLAGGGCLIDLGTHLVDLALWLLGSERAEVLSSHVLRRGEPLRPEASNDVEDHALAELRLDGTAIARLACSWWLPAGRDCAIEVVLYGTEAAVALRNVDGSFYDFTAELQRGTSRELLCSPPDAWGGRAVVEWARRLSDGAAFDPQAEELVRLSRVIDDIYGAAG
jgi:predicted dehydrogenase